jgi:hypothetical protein
MPLLSSALHALVLGPESGGTDRIRCTAAGASERCFASKFDFEYRAALLGCVDDDLLGLEWLGRDV